ncbi:MAG: 30S ribosomal protein S20 [Fusobacteria bacterium]|nr:30S ribosomal protein S20 [Fusobacteriota bacterium]
MAHSKSAKKRIRTNEKSKDRNKSIKSRVKTFIKSYEAKLIAGNAEEAKASLEAACREIDKSVSKGITHRNTAARKKSRLTVSFNKAQA